MAAADDIHLVRLHAAAPPAPTFGAPCNGCGACCAAEPCPLSRLLLGHRAGSCPALTWRDAQARYACGLVAHPSHHLRWLPARADGLASRLARRWIAAGVGCDFAVQVDD